MTAKLCSSSFPKTFECTPHSTSPASPSLLAVIDPFLDLNPEIQFSITSMEKSKPPLKASYKYYVNRDYSNCGHHPFETITFKQVPAFIDFAKFADKGYVRCATCLKQISIDIERPAVNWSGYDGYINAKIYLGIVRDAKQKLVICHQCHHNCGYKMNEYLESITTASFLFELTATIK